MAKTPTVKPRSRPRSRIDSGFADNRTEETQGALFHRPVVVAADEPDPFKKPVPILHSRSKRELTLNQRKTINAFVKYASTTQPGPDGMYDMPLSTYRKDIGFDSRNTPALRETNLGLMSHIFEWDVFALKNKDVVWKASVLFPEIEITRHSVRFMISPEMMGQVKNPGVYALIDMANVRNFRSANALVLYEYCVRYQGVGRTREMPWEEFRNGILSEEQVKAGSYSEYKHFKAKFIKRSLAEICAVTDHICELREVRDGKRVIGIWFEVRRKEAARASDATPDELTVVKELRKLGMPQSEATKLVREYGHERATAVVEYTRRRMNDKRQPGIANPAAYCRTVFQRGLGDEFPGENAAATAPRQEAPQRDVRAEYRLHQAHEAEKYFQELNPDEQEPLVASYDKQQTVKSLKIGGKKITKAAAASFYAWLARETWGEPTEANLIEFVQREWVPR